MRVRERARALYVAVTRCDAFAWIVDRGSFVCCLVAACFFRNRSLVDDLGWMRAYHAVCLFVCVYVCLFVWLLACLFVSLSLMASIEMVLGFVGAPFIGQSVVCSRSRRFPAAGQVLDFLEWEACDCVSVLDGLARAHVKPASFCSFVLPFPFFSHWAPRHAGPSQED